MRNSKLAILASTSLCLGFSAAYAADIPVKAPRPPVALDPWVGFYVGGNIGYSWGKTDTSVSVLPFGSPNLPGSGGFGTYDFPGAAGSASSNVNGVIGGVQAGFVGRIAPHWLGGVEADFQWSGQRGSVSGQVAGLSPNCTSGACSFVSAHDVTARLNYFGTLRGRAGPEIGGFWIYGTGGLAYGSVSVSGTNNLVLFDNSGGAPAVITNYLTPFSYSQLKGGYAAGLGIESLIGDGRWRWKLEYLHIDLGSINGGMFGTFPTVQVNTARFTDEILRMGLNYKLNSDSALNGRMYTKAPAPNLPWTGWFVGVNAGYIDSGGRTNTDVASLTTSSAPANGFNLINSGTNQFNHNSGGFLGGVQAGYNYQFSPSLLMGLEADIQGTSLRQNASGTRRADILPPSWITTTTVNDRLDYLGTVRGRIGGIPRPDLLLYSTGGLAYGGVRSDTQIAFNNDGGAIPGATSGSLSSTRFGYTVGGGLEWMFSPKWTTKLEYLYYDLGSVTYGTGRYAVDVGPTGFPGGGVETIATRTTIRLNGNIARVGLNYKLGG